MIPSARTQAFWYASIIFGMIGVLLAIDNLTWLAAVLFTLSGAALFATIKSDWEERP